MALISIFLCDISWQIKAILTASLIFTFFINYQRHGNYKHPRFICRLSWAGGTDWMVQTRNGRERKMQLTGYYRHPLLVVLNFTGGGIDRCSVVLLPDSSDVSSIRRLRVRLQIQNDETES